LWVESPLCLQLQLHITKLVTRYNINSGYLVIVTFCGGGPDSRMSLNLLRGTGKLIGGDLDVYDKGSEQRRFEPVQSLHHGSIDYQPMHTRIGLAKKVISLQAKREHKQEQERTILNYR
jgi:hypothetical protein